ncbi:MAG: hypothetical protein E7247_04045 [Paenibacillaceae bacterium]|nr:hypothetical protein [Paenibacillaceae bacterium]
MKKYICLRDDDTNYFTMVEELKNGYGEFWGELPITLATIPFVHGSERKILDYDVDMNKFSKLHEWELNANINELNNYYKVFPIGENTGLIEELKKQQKFGKIEIALHGVTHRFNERGAEMYGDQTGFYSIRSGKEYLEKVFCNEINIFVPPSNTIDNICVESLKKLNMHLFSSGTICYQSKFVQILSYLHYLDSVVEKIKRSFTYKRYPIMSRCGIHFFGSSTYGVLCEQEKIYNNLLQQLHQTGFAALGTHYRLLRDIDYRNNYHQLLKKLMHIESVEFVTASRYYKLLEEKYYE